MLARAHGWLVNVYLRVLVDGALVDEHLAGGFGGRSRFRVGGGRQQLRRRRCVLVHRVGGVAEALAALLLKIMKTRAATTMTTIRMCRKQSILTSKRASECNVSAMLIGFEWKLASTFCATHSHMQPALPR